MTILMHSNPFFFNYIQLQDIFFKATIAYIASPAISRIESIAAASVSDISWEKKIWYMENSFSFQLQRITTALFLVSMESDFFYWLLTDTVIKLLEVTFFFCSVCFVLLRYDQFELEDLLLLLLFYVCNIFLACC